VEVLKEAKVLLRTQLPSTTYGLNDYDSLSSSPSFTAQQSAFPQLHSSIMLHIFTLIFPSEDSLIRTHGCFDFIFSPL